MLIAANLLGPPLMVRGGVAYVSRKGKKVWAPSSAGVENPHLLELVDPDGPSLLEDLLGEGAA